MIVKFTHLGKTIFGTVIDDKNYYKIGEFISIPDGEFDNDCNLLLRNNRKIKDFIFKTYVIKRIVRAIELQKLTGGTLTQLPNFRTPEISLNVYLSSEREYKLKLIE